MADTVPRDAAIRVLRVNGVKLSFEDNDATDPAKMVTLEKGERLESMRIPDPVAPRLLQSFKRHYGCGIHQFYNPPILSGQGIINDIVQ